MFPNYKFFLLFALISADVYALSNINDCFLLGPNPSIIIKFANISSNTQKNLSADFLKNISNDSFIFYKAIPIAYGDFVLYFSSKQKNQGTLQNHCYSKNFISSVITELKHRTSIIYAYPNQENTIYGINNYIDINPKQWNLKNPPGGIDVVNAWNSSQTGTGSSNAIVAVLDTGILNNDSLNPNILPGVTFNNNKASVGAKPSCDASCGGYDHGTHVSGIISATGTLAYGQSIFGVAPSTKVLPINVFSKINNCDGHGNPCLTAYDSDITNAIGWLNGYNFSTLPKAPPVIAVNMSLGSKKPKTCPVFFQNALDISLRKNISFFVAAGNGDPPGTPVDAGNYFASDCIGVIPIAATDTNGYGASYSNYGSVISLAAPGGSLSLDEEKIFSTILDNYGYMSGTSQATPHVAGVGALMYSIDPTLNYLTVKNLLQNTTTPFPSGGPEFSCTASKPCGTGILNAFNAAIATQSQAPILQWVPSFTISINSINRVTISWNTAFWQPVRNTPTIYSLFINNIPVSNCQNIEGNNCVINNLIPNTEYELYGSVTDFRKIKSPKQSSIFKFKSFTITPPVINFAVRNPLRKTQAFVYYNTLGNAKADYFSISGTGGIVTEDMKENRLIISDLSDPKKIDNVSIIAHYGSFTIASNPINIPQIL